MKGYWFPFGLLFFHGGNVRTLATLVGVVLFVKVLLTHLLHPLMHLESHLNLGPIHGKACNVADMLSKIIRWQWSSHNLPWCTLLIGNFNNVALLVWTRL